MTDRLFLVPPGALDGAGEGDLVEVGGPEARHAVGVVRLAPGERLLLGDGAGRLASGVVESATREVLAMRVGRVTVQPAPAPRFVLVQALAKGDRDEDAVEAATELGVDEVVPWQADRCIVRWRGERAERSRAKWETVVVAATKQSRRAFVPRVALLEHSESVTTRIAQASLALVLHEDATDPLAGVVLPSSGDVVLVVGPEGGITPGELQRFGSAGARLVRLGSQVLRASTAGPAALAVLSAASRWR